MLDKVDLQVLKLLQGNARASNAEIARQIGLAPSATLGRIRKLELRGIIRGYEARLDPAVLGLGLVAFVFVRSRERAGGVKTGQRLAAIPGVQEVHHVAGEDCFLVKVRAANTEALGRLLRTRFGTLPQIISTRTTIVLGTLKETASLPVPREAEGKKGNGHA
jgi:Lrp/AsnC family leucine-responsive transcriptional regulator